MMMSVALRTGGMVGASTAGFAVVATAGLPQDDPQPQVAGQFEELFRQRHGLVEIGQ